MDSVVSPESAIALGRLGIPAVLNLEGLWTRYADPAPQLEQIRRAPAHESTALLQTIYGAAAIDDGLVAERVGQIREAGVTVAVGVTPQSAGRLAPVAVAAGIDILVIRGTTVSAEHVSTGHAPLNLKTFIYDLEVPVIVGIRVPMASAIADVAAARRDYLDESGGRYVHVIADGSVGSSGALVKAIACGADAAMVGSLLARASDAPGNGVHWGAEAWHAHLPRGERKELGVVGSLEQILCGPSTHADGSANIIGALRKAMATTGYSDLKEFQRIDVVLDPE
jgi:IMP dehydrogenase